MQGNEEKCRVWYRRCTKNLLSHSLSNSHTEPRATFDSHHSPDQDDFYSILHQIRTTIVRAFYLMAGPY